MSPLFSNVEKIILASASPRRCAYFEDLGLSFAVQPADVEEKQQAGEGSHSYVMRLAEEKARAVGGRNRKNWIVAADTVINFQDRILEKPVDSYDARKMLMLLSGKEHLVQTAVCLFHESKFVCEVIIVTTRVLFWDFSAVIAEAYVQSGEPMDKAGSYGIQGRGAFLVREIQGSYSNVVGLPLCELLELLARYHVISQ